MVREKVAGAISGWFMGALWIALLYLWCRRSFRRWIIERGAGA